MHFELFVYKGKLYLNDFQNNNKNRKFLQNMTQKAEFQIQANEMNNRPAFPSCRRSVIYFTRAQWHVCFFLDVVPTPAVLTEAFSFHPAGICLSREMYN